MSDRHTDFRERPLPTEPTSHTPAESMDAPGARRTATEMAALTRVLFGVPGPLQKPADPSPPPNEAPMLSTEQVSAEQVAAPPLAPQPSPPAPAVGIPVPHGIPVPQPAASSPHPPVAAPAEPGLPAVAPESIPVPEIPSVTSATGSGENLEPAREAQRRQVGPSLQLLQEIAFLEE